MVCGNKCERWWKQNKKGAGALHHKGRIWAAQCGGLHAECSAKLDVNVTEPLNRLLALVTRGECRSVCGLTCVCSCVSLCMSGRPGGGGGVRLEKWGSVSGPLFCVRTDVGAEGAGTQKFGPKRFFPPMISPPQHLSSQNDQGDVGIILSHRCWVDPPPPPRHGRSGTPALNPPLPSRRRGRGGGGWVSVSPPPPPQSNFLPAVCRECICAALRVSAWLLFVEQKPSRAALQLLRSFL